MKNAKYFTLKEMIDSTTAKNMKIDNTPDFEKVKKLNNLAVNYLDPLREAWGQPINITSGYRSPELNEKVNGSKTSSHMAGEAVDMQPKDKSLYGVEKFYNFIKQYFTNNNIIIDQCFIEHSKTSSWIHLGISEKMRNQYGKLIV